MKRPALMGIVNVTPDSFSGDGLLAADAVRHAFQLVLEGADILDIGAESTRPGAIPVDDVEEWQRLAPVLHGIIEHDWRPRVRLSVDTRHAQTARRVLDMCVDIINDVSGLADAEMAEMLGEHGCDVVVMHALTIPASKTDLLPPDCDVVAEVLRWKELVAARAAAAGIGAERLIYDPGLGFGKSAVQSMALVTRAGELVASGGRWLFGHSRKSFLSLLTDAPAQGRDDATLTLSLQLAEAGVDYLRVHNISRHVSLLGV